MSDSKKDNLAETSVSQFAGRDPSGLLPEDKAKPEAKARLFYLKLIGGCMIFYEPILSSVIYFVCAFLFERQAGLYAKKFDFLIEYDLGYVYLAWLLIAVGRSYATINANGARAPARVDRPDQYVYQIMAESGPLANAPYVMLTTSGEVGRFNRAQRVCGNLDENMPFVLSAVVLCGAVFPLVSVSMSAMYAYGAYVFANDYKDGTNKRIAGFMLVSVPLMVMRSMVTLTAFMTLIRPLMPF